MIVTIEGSKAQVRDACRQLARALRDRLGPNHGRGGRRMLPATQARYDAVQADRRIIRQAFDLIRHDPAEKMLADYFAGALGGIRGKITPALLETARQIIAERGHQQSVTEDK